ncbi:MAG: hypothetical protein WCI54_00675 [Bacteroidia bacterium]
MKNGNKNVLKGQANLAQGKRSDALGWRTGERIARTITVLERLSLFRTKVLEFQFPASGRLASGRNFHL